MSRSTISRHLTRAGLVTPEPKKRPKSSYIRFEAAHAERDLAVRLHPLPAHPTRRAPGADVEIISWLDDCTRYALHVTAHPRITAPIVIATFRETASPARDPGLHADRQRHGLHRPPRRRPRRPQHLRARAPPPGTSSRRTPDPNHPTTCGKAERFQQTMKKWLRAQPVQPTTIAELQALLDAFADEYNHRRPHRSLPHRATPAALYDTMPKATARRRPATPTPTTGSGTTASTKPAPSPCAHDGRLHHIGIGRTHAGTCVILLVQDLQIRIVNATTGELLRELILDPHRDYQPTGAPKGPTQEMTTAEPAIAGPAVADVLRHHIGSGGRI